MMNEGNLIILLSLENNLYMKVKHFSRKTFFNVSFLPSIKSTSQYELRQGMSDWLIYRNVSIYCNSASSQRFSHYGWQPQPFLFGAGRKSLPT